MAGTVFTIGYEGASFERFAERLTGAGVAVVADLRAVALSRRKGFSKRSLAAGLAEAGIGYEHFIALGTPKEGRDAARAGDHATLDRIYAGTLATPEAREALEALAGLAARSPAALLCFERDPAVCHRRMVADRLAARGFGVEHLFVDPA